MKKRLYIAYGSNLCKEQMSRRCPTAKAIAKTWLHDYRLVFQGGFYGAHANVIPEDGQDVPVAIWEISAKDEAALDKYEGVSGGYYTKEIMTVEVDGEMKEALVYIMSRHPFGTPTERYLATIVEGYRDFNFPVRTLNEAVSYSYDNAEYYPPAN